MFRKIGIKLIFIVSISIFVIVGIFSYYSIKHQSEVLQSEVERHANQLSEVVKNSTRFDMLFNRREHITEIISTIGNSKSITGVRVFNKEGYINYSSNPKEIGTQLDLNAESCYACHAKNEPLEHLTIKERTRIFQIHPDSVRMMGVINPIYNEPSCYEADCHVHSKESKVLGVLDVTISLAEVDRQVSELTFWQIIFTLITIVVLGFILGYFVEKLVDKPVTELVKATNYISMGDLSYKVTAFRKDEIGQLANSFNNMTKRLSEMKMQLFQSEKMASLGQLAAGVAHEINNPLTGVLTYASYLQKRTKDNPEMQEDLGVIVRETLRSREIVKGLLDFARQSPPKKAPANIPDIFNRAISVLGNQIKLHNINIIKEFDPNFPQITVDSNQIQQVFINLIVNSIDAIGNKPGEIKIKTKVISLPPFGVEQIKQAACSKGHNLIDYDHKIDGLPSIKVKAVIEGNEGFIHIDPIYGRGRNHYGIPVTKTKSIDIKCPVCDISLVNKSKKCEIDGSDVYEIIIPNKGILEGSTKLGSTWQRWEYIEKSGKKDFAEITISDNGCGIPKDNLDKIFDPFFSTKGQKGTGLGLSVIWGIIDNHDGTIEVISEVNKGTSFIIRLPIG
jgi:two-component system NtrC family sensor kinase